MRVKFADVLTVVNGKNQRKVENPSGKYPIYGSGGIMGYADKYICEADTVIIGRKGSINSPIFVDTPFWNVDTAFGLCADRSKLIPKYLYYFCLSFDFVSLNTTVTIPSLTKTNLLNVEIPLPPLDEQRRIAAVLDKVSSLITKRREQLRKLDELVKARFVEMFGDPSANSHWSTHKLSELGELNRGISKHRPRNDPKLLGGPYPLIQTGDVSNSGLYIQNYSATYSEFGLAQSRLWKKGTLCITIAANIAQTSILAFDACFPDSVVGFLPGEKTNVVFVHYWFSFFQKILEEQAPQVAQKNINLKILSDLDVIVPPYHLQADFSNFVGRIENCKLTIQHSLDTIETLKKALMQEYFG